jgi:hypothetical protein
VNSGRTRVATGDELEPVAVLHRREQLFRDRHDDALDLFIDQEALDGVLQDRLAGERLELLRNRAAEAHSETGGGNDGDEAGHGRTSMMRRVWQAWSTTPP